jgi:hypothetical protein
MHGNLARPVTATQCTTRFVCRRRLLADVRTGGYRATMTATSWFRPLLLALPMSLAQGQTPGAAAPTGAPDTDIFLSRVTRRDGAVLVQPPLNLTRRPGYDNQPSFDARGRVLYYTRRAPNALLRDSVRDVQTDIWRYALDGSDHTPAITTAESEYSAQITPDGAALTVIRVERDSAQHLWRMPLSAAGRAERLVGTVKPVGYYAWVGSQVVMFVLGAPATLQLMDTVGGRLDTIARDIGRGVKRVPGTNRVTFVQKAGAQWFIDELDVTTRAVTRLVATLPNVEEYAWLDSTTMIAGSGTTLRTWSRGQPAWALAADLSYAPLTGISRVTIDPTGTWLAFVATPTPARPAGASAWRPRVREADVARDLAHLSAHGGTPDRLTRQLAGDAVAGSTVPRGRSGSGRRQRVCATCAAGIHRHRTGCASASAAAGQLGRVRFGAGRAPATGGQCGWHDCGIGSSTEGRIRVDDGALRPHRHDGRGGR